MKKFLIFALLTICWVALRLPTVPQAIMDADSGHQLAGATQILHGQHPFVDFEATYGPLVFYASALAQVVFGERFLSEIVLCTLGYALAYGLLAVLMTRISRRKSIVFLFTALALLAMPRLYKYYIVLGPVLTLFFACRYIDQPKTSRLLWLALAVTIAGLFRADMGMYCTVAATVTGALTPSLSRTVLVKRLATLYGFIVLWAMPWLLFLALSGGLFRYFYDAAAGSLNIASGMSLQFPAFQPNQPIFSESNLLVFTSAFFFTFPIIAALFLAWRWRALQPKPRIMLASTVVLYALSLIQAISRADTPHLLQTLPLAFLLAAWIADDLMQFKPVALTLILLFSTPILLTPRSGWATISLLELPQKLTQFALPKEKLLTNANVGGRLGYATAMLYIRRCTREPQRIMALPALTTFPYFTDRAFGGGQMGVLAGYFVTQADQQRLVAKMQNEDIPLMVYTPNFAYDNLPERTLEVVAPIVAGYIQSNYDLLKEIGALHLLVRHDLTVTQRGASLDDYSCPVLRP